MILNIAHAIIVFFLGLRIIFFLFQANSATPFVQWIYNISDGLVSPFRGIFPNLTFGSASQFDVSAFIALIAYTLLFSLIGMILRALIGPRDNYIVTDRGHTLA